MKFSEIIKIYKEKMPNDIQSIEIDCKTNIIKTIKMKDKTN